MYISESDCFGLVPLPIKEPHSSEAGNSKKQSTITTQLFIEETDFKLLTQIQESARMGKYNTSHSLFLFECFFLADIYYERICFSCVLCSSKLAFFKTLQYYSESFTDLKSYHGCEAILTRRQHASEIKSFVCEYDGKPFSHKLNSEQFVNSKVTTLGKRQL